MAPVSKEDLPKRIVICTEKVYVQSKEPTLGQMAKREIKHAIADEVYDAINDLRKRAVIISRAKQFWHVYVKPLFASEKKDVHKYGTKAEEILDQKQQQAEITYQVETLNSDQRRIVVTGEQAARMIEAMRQKAKSFPQ